MKDYITKEQFIEEVEKLWLEARSDDGDIRVITKEIGHTLAHIDDRRVIPLEVAYRAYKKLDADTQKKLYEFVVRYARTPVNKRREQKRYRLRLDISCKIENNWQILARNTDDKSFHVGSGRGSDRWQTIFTQAEIDEMGDLTKGFVKEEV